MGWSWTLELNWWQTCGVNVGPARGEKWHDSRKRTDAITFDSCGCESKGRGWDDGCAFIARVDRPTDRPTEVSVHYIIIIIVRCIALGKMLRHVWITGLNAGLNSVLDNVTFGRVSHPPPQHERVFFAHSCSWRIPHAVRSSFFCITFLGWCRGDWLPKLGYVSI